jgi:hypothetical protein
MGLAAPVSGEVMLGVPLTRPGPGFATGLALFFLVLAVLLMFLRSLMWVTLSSSLAVS